MILSVVGSFFIEKSNIFPRKNRKSLKSVDKRVNLGYSITAIEKSGGKHGLLFIY